MQQGNNFGKQCSHYNVSSFMEFFKVSILSRAVNFSDLGFQDLASFNSNSFMCFKINPVYVERIAAKTLERF